jgi:hypothetical protein
MPRPTTWLCLAALPFIAGGCDRDEKSNSPPAAPLPTAPPFPAAAPVAPVAPPEIIVDSNHVAVGKEQVPTADRGLTDRVASLLALPGIEGRAVDVVTMRNVRPSQVEAVLVALRGAKASGATLKTLTREGTTQKLPISFSTSTPGCTTVAWIAKDAAIAVWPAGGGVAKRIIRGLAGPDITLGLEAIGARQAGCSAPGLVIGADEAMTWGLVFDLATSALQAPGAHASEAILVTSATPGRPVELK